MQVLSCKEAILAEPEGPGVGDSGWRELLGIRSSQGRGAGENAPNHTTARWLWKVNICRCPQRETYLPVLSYTTSWCLSQRG